MEILPSRCTRNTYPTLPSLKMCLAVVLFCGYSFLLPAQIVLQNPSFEGKPQDATTPVSWLGCQPKTTPDILPGPWGVKLEAARGNTYVGLITRYDGSYESIGQRTSQPLKAKECYTFTVHVAKGSTYNGYNSPVRLRIWGGFNKCDLSQLIMETEPIKNTSWEKITVRVTPKRDINYLIFEAYFAQNPKKPYNGNLLIDNISAIVPCIRAESPTEKVNRL